MEESNDKVIQKQIAKDESNQFQVGTVIVNQGITEERARNIFEEMIPQALINHTQDAYRTANGRIDKLETVVMPRIMGIDGALAMFADPAFQILLRKAQQTAAATEREDDYNLLSELLVCHIQKGEDRKNRTGISKAIEIVDDIDNDALCALTLVHAVSKYLPVTGNIKEGFQVLDDLFEKLLYMTPPEGVEWIEHLDVLGAVRITQLGNFKKIKEYFTEQLSGYACVGLKVDSEEYKNAIELLSGVNLSSNLLVSHELMEGYARLPVPNKKAISEMTMISFGTIRKINTQEITVLEKIWDLYSRDTLLENSVCEEFIQLWDSFTSLKQLHMWWESIPISFDITKVGTVLAHTNAKRCDQHIPDLL